jgi:glycosyltransferase involved in cell wall biosynthesis
MARPIYGGWVSFTAHLSLKYKLPLYKIGNKTETKERDFGYGVGYTNIAKSDIKKGKLLITAIDKNYYDTLDLFPDGTIIVIHDPTEVKAKVAEPLLKHLKRFHVVTIRKSVQTYLKSTYNIKSKFILHPFFEYEFEKDKSPTKAVSISRIDFDKHTDILLEANKHLPKPLQIEIYGAINRQYVFFSLKDKGFTKFYKGQFEKSFEELSDILKDAKYVTDMSVIKNDGGGTQYTFLEAIYQECILIINNKWVEDFETPFVNKKNCFVVSNGEELAELLKSNPSSSKILKEAMKILQPHIEVNWPKELSRF